MIRHMVRAAFIILTLCIGCLVASDSHAQGPGYNRIPNSTIATTAVNCGEPTVGPMTMCLITDGASSGDCTMGGGSTQVLCWYDSNSWEPVIGSVASGSSLTITAAAPSLIYKDSDATDGDNNVTLFVNCSDTGSGSEDCDATLTVQVAGVAKNAILVDADDEINLLPQNEVEIANNATGSVDVCLSDFADATTDTTCNHVIVRGNLTDTGDGSEDGDYTVLVPEAGGNPDARFVIDGDGGITLGSSDNNSVTITTDSTGSGEVVLPNGAVANAELTDDTVDFDKVSDSPAIDADTAITAGDGIELSLTAEHTSGDTEALTIAISQPDDGAATDDLIGLKVEVASESGDAGDTIRGMSMVVANGTANTIVDAGIAIDNAETTASTLTDGIIITSSGVAAGVTDGLDVSAANITNAVNIGINPILGGNSDSISVGASDAVVLLARNDAGAVTLTSNDDDTTAALTVDPGGNATLTLGSASDTVTAAATSGLTMSNAETVSNGTDAIIFLGRNDAGTVTLTAKDDDATAALSIVAGGTSTLTLGDSADTVTMGTTSAALTLGSNLETINGATNGAITFTRNDAGAVTLTAADDDATAAITLDPGGNATLTLGSASDTVTSAATSGVTFSQAESIHNNSANGTLTMARNDAGIVTVTAADDDATAALTVLPGGAAAMVLGGASTTALTVTTDSTGTAEVVLPADSIGAGEIDDLTCMQVIAVSYNPTEAGATDDYVSLIAVDTATGDASFGATENAEDQFILPVAMKAVSLRVDVATAPGVGNDPWTIALRENGATTALTCAIDEAETSCTDASNQEALAAGADIDILVISSGAAADPDANAEMRIAFCLTAD